MGGIGCSKFSPARGIFGCILIKIVTKDNYKEINDVICLQPFRAFAAESSKVVIMQNEAGETVDLYVPRKCSATNRLITSNDKAAVQINVGHVDAEGRYTGEFSVFNICGFVRDLGESDEHVYRLWQETLDKHAGSI